MNRSTQHVCIWGDLTPPSLNFVIYKMKHLPVLSIQLGHREAEPGHINENT